MVNTISSRNPLFSVIIPVRNGMKTVRRAVLSVLNQTYSNVEAVVIVNGTTDRTMEVLAEIKDNRLRVLELPGAGRSHARNTGITTARGEYFIFLDADDELLPARVRNAWSLLHSGFDAVQGAALYVSPTGASQTVLPHLSKNFVGRLYVRNTIAINTLTLHREFCSSFPEETEFCEDWEFWLRTLPGLNIATYTTPDSVVHKLEGSTSSDVARMKSHEIPVYLGYRPPALPPLWRLKRTCLFSVALVFYAGLEPIPTVERALRQSLAPSVTVRALRRLPRTRKFAQTMIRLVFPAS